MPNIFTGLKGLVLGIKAVAKLADLQNWYNIGYEAQQRDDASPRAPSPINDDQLLAYEAGREDCRLGKPKQSIAG